MEKRKPGIKSCHWISILNRSLINLQLKFYTDILCKKKRGQIEISPRFYPISYEKPIIIYVKIVPVFLYLKQKGLGEIFHQFYNPTTWIVCYIPHFYSCYLNDHDARYF